MERVARDSARDHLTVMDVLAAFVREHSLEKWPPQARNVGPRPTLRPDVQAAMTVIGRRTVSYDHQPINLTDANLPGAELEKANLTRVNFYFANLTGAWLVDANLTNANLTAASLAHTNLTGANLTDTDLCGADITDADWPVGVAVPEHWRHSILGNLERVGSDPSPTGLTNSDSHLEFPYMTRKKWVLFWATCDEGAASGPAA